MNPTECFYKLKICARGGGTNNNGQNLEVERKFDVTDFYDEGGYLHRYKVKEMFDETLQKFINAQR